MKYSELKKQVADAQRKASDAQRKASDAQRELEEARAITVRVVGNAPKQALVEFRLRQRTDALSYDMYADQTGFKAGFESLALRQISRELLMSGLLRVRSEFVFDGREQMTEFSLWVAKV